MKRLHGSFDDAVHAALTMESMARSMPISKLLNEIVRERYADQIDEWEREGRIVYEIERPTGTIDIEATLVSRYLAEQKRAEQPAAPAELWTDGDASPEAREAMERLRARMAERPDDDTDDPEPEAEPEPEPVAQPDGPRYCPAHPEVLMRGSVCPWCRDESAGAAIDAADDTFAAEPVLDDDSE